MIDEYLENALRLGLSQHKDTKELGIYLIRNFLTARTYTPKMVRDGLYTLLSPIIAQLLQKKGSIVSVDPSWSDIISGLGRELYDFSAAGIKELPEEIAYLSAVRQLDISKNELVQLPDALWGLRKLQILEMNGNRLGVISARVGQLEALRLLDVSHNRLDHLPDAIWGLPVLDWLYASGNQLPTISPAVGRMGSRLRRLRLDGNALYDLPEEMEGLQGLEELRLSGNNLYEVPAVVARLRCLRHLELGGNAISALPEEMSALTRLEKLDVRGNELDHLPEVLYGLPALREVWLEGNPVARRDIDKILKNKDIAFTVYWKEMG